MFFFFFFFLVSLKFDSVCFLLYSSRRPPVFIPVDNSMGAVLSVMQGMCYIEGGEGEKMGKEGRKRQEERFQLN